MSGRRLRSVSVPRKGHHNDQENQTNRDKFISDMRKKKERKMRNLHRASGQTNQKHRQLTPISVYSKFQRFKYLLKESSFI